MSRNQIENQIVKLGELFFQLDADEQRIARHLYHLLAKGTPVKLKELADRSGIALSKIENVVEGWPGVYRNDEDAVIGFWGLAIEPVSNHQFIVNGQTLYAWCAWDTLFIPAHIGETCHVHATCKHTGDPIELAVSPRGVERSSPESIHLSFVLPEKDAIDKGVITSFCHFIHFFRDHAAAAAWTKGQQGGFILSLEDAVAAAHHKVAFEFPHIA